MDISYFIILFSVAFFINLTYEVLHSWLYTTCRMASWRRYAFLIGKGALFDASVVVLGYLAMRLVLRTENFFTVSAIGIYLALNLMIAYGWEVYSLRQGKWQYSSDMPLVFGVGVTPLVQLALTGWWSLYIASVFYYN